MSTNCRYMYLFCNDVPNHTVIVFFKESNSTAMHLAAKNGHYDVVKLLYEHGADAVMNYKDAV